jgi:hypothetical protein
MTLPIEEFLIEKIHEYDPDFDTREGTGFKDLFIKPAEIIVQPFRDELDIIESGQTILGILEAEDPNLVDENLVDGLMSNSFGEGRNTGSKTTGSVRVSFVNPRDLDLSPGDAIFLDKLGNRFPNINSTILTKSQMSLNLVDDFYYADISVEAESENYIEVGVNEIVEWENAPDDVVSITNLVKFTPGSDKETNVEYIERTKESIAVRDLVVRKGINGVLFKNFNTIEELQVIGHGDPEMQRDIKYNIHTGNFTDIWIKTPMLQEGEFLARAILNDLTRRKPLFTNKTLIGFEEISLGIISIDRTEKIPVIREITDETYPVFTTTVDLVAGIDLSLNYNIKIQLLYEGLVEKEYQIGCQGVVPAVTTRSEIITKINTVFGFSLAAPYNTGGQFIRLTGNKIGSKAEIRFVAPTGNDATQEITGLNEATYPHIFSGTSPIVYVENIDYELDDSAGTIKRLTGSAIADGDLVEIECEYNPISIDIGIPVRQSDGTYVIRTGRNNYTIIDLVFIAVVSIEIVDPTSGEGTGEFLDSTGGYGQGGYGKGGYGVGSGSDYRMIVINPHHRYSMLEESYIEINPKYLGYDLKVTFKYAPEISSIHDFVRSPNERVTVADLLVKHFIPVFIDIEITYDISASKQNSLKTNSETTNIVGEAVNDAPPDKPLQVSDIIKLLYDEGAIKVDLPINLKAEIHHLNGTKEFMSTQDELVIASDEILGDDPKPLSPRIAHFIPRNIVLNRRLVNE